MIDKLIKKYVKDYVIKKINELLKKYKNDVNKVLETINYWTLRLSLIIELLKKISSRCSDNELDDEEVNDSLNEINEIIKQF